MIWGIAHFCRSNMTKDMVKSMKKLDRKKCKKLQIWNFLKNQFFRILIISKVTFDLEECTIPKIKAKNISFGPYFVNFLAKLNILWERKQWSCLIFFCSRLYMASFSVPPFQSYYLRKAELSLFGGKTEFTLNENSWNWQAQNNLKIQSKKSDNPRWTFITSSYL